MTASTGKLPILIALLLQPSFFFASDPVINVNVQPDTIGLNENAAVVVEVSEKAEKLIPSKANGYELSYRGESHNSQVTIVNGKFTASSTVSYTFVLTAKKKGELVIAPFQVTVRGKTYVTPEKKIKVVQEVKRQSYDPFEELRNFYNRGPRLPELFILMKPSKDFYYQNEQIVVDAIYLSSDKEALDYRLIEAGPMSNDKMITYDLSGTLDGTEPVFQYGNYWAKTVRRYVLYPIDTGTVRVLPPVVVAVTPYGQVQLKGDAADIEVYRLKNEAGISYIGDLDIQVRLSTNETVAGRSLDVTLEMRGTGNLKVFANPYGTVGISGLLINPPVTKIEPVSSGKTEAVFRQNVRYSVLAQKGGDYTLPSVVIQYYDRALNRRELRTAPLSFHVAGDTNARQGVAYSLKALSVPRNFSYMLFNPLVILLLAIFALLPAGAFLYGRHVKRLASDPDYSRRRGAGKRLSKYLAEAEGYRLKGQPREFYLSLQKSVFYYLTDKLNLPSGMGLKELLKAMEAKGVSAENRSLFENVYNECGYQAYSGAGKMEGSEELIGKCQGLINSLKF